MLNNNIPADFTNLLWNENSKKKGFRMLRQKATQVLP